MLQGLVSLIPNEINYSPEMLETRSAERLARPHSNSSKLEKRIRGSLVSVNDGVGV